MKQNEIEIVAFLQSLFATTSYAQNRHLLLPESESCVDGSRKRIPDLTHFSPDQLQAIRRGERVKTLFAIEILSDSETHEDVWTKLPNAARKITLTEERN